MGPHRLLGLVIVSAVLSQRPGHAQQVEPDRWFFRSDPYLWTADISGTATVGDVTVPIDPGSEGTSSEISLLGNVFVEVGRNRWSGVFEIGTVSFDDSTVVGEGAPPGTSLSYSYTVFLFRLMAVYRVTALEASQGLSVLAGLRYNSHDLDVDAYEGPPDLDLAFSEGWFDPTVGIRYHAPLPGNFMVTASAEIGGFGIGSEFSWSTTGVLGWRFSRPVGITLGYRYMSVDYRSPSSVSSDSFAYEGNLHGPMLGVLLVL